MAYGPDVAELYELFGGECTNPGDIPAPSILYKSNQGEFVIEYKCEGVVDHLIFERRDVPRVIAAMKAYLKDTK